MSTTPLVHIGDTRYRLSEPLFLSNNSDHTMTVVNDQISIYGDESCNISGNYNQSWWYDSQFFRLADGYTNLTFWRNCDQITGNNFVSEALNFKLCGDVWYYSLNTDFDSEGGSFCSTHLQLPSNKEPIEIKPLLAQGFKVTWNVDPDSDRRCDTCLNSTGSCGYDKSNLTFLCYCGDGTIQPDECPRNGPQHPGRSTNSAIKIGLAVAAALVTIALVLFLACYAKRRKTHSRGVANDFGKYGRKDTEAASALRKSMIGDLPIFSYEELRQATNCFHEKNEIGDGGFGSVYLGKLRDGRTVAVKRLYQDNSRRLEQFLNEVKVFSFLNHPYVVRLYGCTSAESPELLLVYEFVSNGTLAEHLHGDRRCPKGLPWDTRLNIAIQTAKALAFLHSVDPPIFHRDVKSSNILLDDNFNVKVADFGLCRLVPLNASHVTTAPQGTPGYVDPEYHECFQLTEKSDVYSFGVVLVEIISAKLAVDINRKRGEINLAYMATSKIQEGALHELVDPQLEIEKNDQVEAMVSAVAELIFRCLASEGDDRPHMKEVVAQLELIRGPVPTRGEQRGSFHYIKLPISPTSVQDKWPSISSTPNNSS